eukprot:scaffold111_cov252-Pinguiococcus_pyrenoidosus.AAC.30
MLLGEALVDTDQLPCSRHVSSQGFLECVFQGRKQILRRCLRRCLRRGSRSWCGRRAHSGSSICLGVLLKFLGLEQDLACFLCPPGFVVAQGLLLELQDLVLRRRLFLERLEAAGVPGLARGAGARRLRIALRPGRPATTAAPLAHDGGRSW